MAYALLIFVSLYASIGAIGAVWFVWRGVVRLDPAARGSPWTFRLLIFPGVVALWPALALRWRIAGRKEQP